MCEVIYPPVPESLLVFFFPSYLNLSISEPFQGRNKVKRRSPKTGLLRHVCWLGLSAQCQDRRSYQTVQKAFAHYSEVVCMPLRINRAQLENTFHYLLRVLNLNYPAHLTKFCVRQYMFAELLRMPFLMKRGSSLGVSDLNSVCICTHTGSSEREAPQGVPPGERGTLGSA